MRKSGNRVLPVRAFQMMQLRNDLSVKHDCEMINFIYQVGVSSFPKKPSYLLIFSLSCESSKASLLPPPTIHLAEKSLLAHFPSLSLSPHSTCFVQASLHHCFLPGS